MTTSRARLEDQIALLRSDLRIFQSASALPRWIGPSIIAALSLVVLLVGVLLVLIVVIMLQLSNLEERVLLNETWVRTHRHDGGPQPPSQQFKKE